MNYEKFAIWLSGFVDLTPGQLPTKEQWQLITERLAETFDKPRGVGAPTITVVNTASPATGGFIGEKPEGYGVWGSEARAEAITTLEARVSKAGSSITALNNTVGALTSTVSGKADSSALSALTTRLTSAEGNITSQGTAITSLQSSVSALQSSPGK